MLGFRVATPVLELLEPLGRRPRAGVVRGVGRTAAYVDFDGFVVALTARGVALMPNGIALSEQPGTAGWPRVGAPARLGAGGLQAGPGSVAWGTARPPAWDPVLRVARATAPSAIRARGAAILGARGIDAADEPARLAGALATGGVDADARDGVALLLRSVAARDPALAARAGELLVGRGGGLTPEGDDLLAATAATVATLAVPAGWTPDERAAWLVGVLPSHLRDRTTALSATLLELAIAGRAIEPLHGLLDFGEAGERRWDAALRRLVQIGHSTGPAYAAAAGATALLCPV